MAQYWGALADTNVQYMGREGGLAFVGGHTSTVININYLLLE